MIRGIGLMACLLGAVSIAVSDDRDNDPVREKLFAAKVMYDREMQKFRIQASEWFDMLEGVARKDRNNNLVDQVRRERKTFDESGELPKGIPSTIQQKPAAAKKALETAYGQAVKEYVKAKEDARAAAVGTEFAEFKKNTASPTDARREDTDEIKLLKKEIELLKAKLEAADLKIEILQKENEQLKAAGTAGTKTVANVFGVGTKFVGTHRYSKLDAGKRLDGSMDVEFEVTARSGKEFTAKMRWDKGMSAAELAGTIDGGVVRFKMTKVLAGNVPGDLVDNFTFSGELEKGSLKGDTTKPRTPQQDYNGKLKLEMSKDKN